MRRKPKTKSKLGTTSSEVTSWVLSNYPRAQEWEVAHGSLDGFDFPSEDAKSVMVYVMLDPKNGLKTLIGLRHQAELKAASRRPKSAVDDLRRQFTIIDRLAAAIPQHPMPGGPDLGVDPEQYRPE